MTQSTAPVDAGHRTGRARLIDSHIPAEPEGVVLVLHGGGNRGRPMEVSPAQLSVLRMIPVAARIAAVTKPRLAVLRLLNSRRGWDSTHTPVDDVDWALAEVATRFGGDLPVGLVGHSLGGRAALLSAGQAQVAGVVALAPWVYPDDIAAGVADTLVLIIHGDEDRVALPERSRRLAAVLGRETPVSYVTVAGGRHAMLARRRSFDGLAADAVAWMLLGEVRGSTVQALAAGPRELRI
ncbi:MAG TPA: alpha/beta hydrolase [Solirubrobacteraceae bacterium]|nr:alpha/beta hydrolase [Solirubrobacteraceae bacterium]